MLLITIAFSTMCSFVSHNPARAQPFADNPGGRTLAGPLVVIFQPCGETKPRVIFSSEKQPRDVCVSLLYMFGKLIGNPPNCPVDLKLLDAKGTTVGRSLGIASGQSVAVCAPGVATVTTQFGGDASQQGGYELRVDDGM
jgi:hypothetical protein